jgi:hypothetical protein
VLARTRIRTARFPCALFPWTTVVIAGLIAMLATAGPVNAQGKPDDESPSQTGSRPVILQPLHLSIAREAALVSESRELAFDSDTPSDPERSWISRHRVWTGALIGTTAGAIRAHILCRGGCEGDSRPYVLFFGGVGAGIGAGTGALISIIVR